MSYDPSRSVTSQIKDILLSAPLNTIVSSVAFAEQYELPKDAVSAAFSKLCASGYMDGVWNGHQNNYRLVKSVETWTVKKKPSIGSRPRLPGAIVKDHTSWKDRFLSVMADVERLLENPNLSAFTTEQLVDELARRSRRGELRREGEGQ